MLSEEQIRQALHADRVVDLKVPNPHGPIGLEHVAEAVSSLSRRRMETVERPIAFPVETWKKLDEFARRVSHDRTEPMTASEFVASLFEEGRLGLWDDLWPEVNEKSKQMPELPLEAKK